MATARPLTVTPAMWSAACTAATHGAQPSEWLLARCKTGDASAWRELYDGHVNRLWRFLTTQGVADTDLQDVAQEVFLVLFRRIADFDGRAAFTTWMFGIAVRLGRNYRRSRFRTRLERLFGLRPAETGETRADDAPDSRLERDESTAEILSVLSRLPPHKREVLVLHDVEGLEGPAIAEILGCPVRTVWSRLRSARSEFGRFLRQGRLARTWELCP